MIQSVYVLVGVPGSGKTWVCRQLSKEYPCVWVPHQQEGEAYVRDVFTAWVSQTKNVLAEAPISARRYREVFGDALVCVYVIESAEVTAQRYYEREGRVLGKQFLSRLITLQQEATQYGCFHGTSTKVLMYLRTKLKEKL